MSISLNINGSRDAGTDRRRFLKYVGGLGAATVGAIAVSWADVPRAAAVTRRPSDYIVGCCGLATHTPCGGAWGNDGHFLCPSGFQKEFWLCVTSRGVTYACWECKNVENHGTNCFSGDDPEDYICSNWATSR
jgi:hypothetical protein